MAEKTTGEMQATLGLTGLTMNAMALIAPGAFLWLTFYAQATEGATSPVDVDRDHFRSSAVPGHRSLLCGNGEAVSRNRQFVLFRRAVVPESRQGMAIRPAFEVHRGLGLASVLLDLSGRDGRGHRNFQRIHRRNALAEFHERFESRSDVHDAGRRSVHLRRGLHRASRREWLDGGQHCHQRDSDLRSDRVLRDGDRLPDESCAGQRGLPVGFDNERSLQLRIQNRIANRERSEDRRDRSRREHGAATDAGCRRKACALPHQLSRKGFDGEFPEPSERQIGGRNPQLWLDVRSGHGRHLDPGGI